VRAPGMVAGTQETQADYHNFLRYSVQTVQINDIILNYLLQITSILGFNSHRRPHYGYRKA
jgi:hypothetical protein